jgi:PIN domain nuclease of toxin-antitoxin system
VKFLLDTHVLLWAAGQPDRLRAKVRRLLGDPLNELVFSAASLWEIAMKKGLGRDDFQVDARSAPVQKV